MVKSKCDNKPYKLQSELKDLNKIKGFDKNLREIKGEILADYAGEFETSEKLPVGDQIRETDIGFIKMSDYEHYFNLFDEGYDAKDIVFNGYI